MLERLSANAYAGLATEKDFMQAVVMLAKLTGWMVYHTHDSRRSQPGFPDLVLVKPPRLLFIECKSEAGKLTAEQVHWIEDLQAVTESPKTYVVRPSDWDTIARVLQGR